MLSGFIRSLASFFFASLVLVFACGCSLNTLIETFANDEKEKVARDYIQRLSAGETVALSTEISPELRTADIDGQLKQMSRLLAGEAPAVTNLVGYNSQFSEGTATYNLTYQFGFGSRWVLANVAWREAPDGKREIIGLSARPLAASLQEINAFSFKKAGAMHYLCLGAMIVIPIFIITTLLVCIRTKIARRKWLWIVFILIGIASFSLNWTTGQTRVSPASIHLLGIGVAASSPYSPWIISVSIPLGAFVFWLKRKKLVGPPPVPPQSEAVG
jgi:hypothetical protein